MLPTHGYAITTPSDDVIDMQYPLLDRKWSGANYWVHIDWKGLALQECRSRIIRRGMAPCKALHQSPAVPRHYSVWPIKTWVGKCANNIMLVWVLWQVNCDLSLDGSCMWNCASGVKPPGRVIISQDPWDTDAMWGKWWWRNNMQDKTLKQYLEVSPPVSKVINRWPKGLARSLIG